MGPPSAFWEVLTCPLSSKVTDKLDVGDSYQGSLRAETIMSFNRLGFWALVLYNSLHTLVCFWSLCCLPLPYVRNHFYCYFLGKVLHSPLFLVFISRLMTLSHLMAATTKPSEIIALNGNIISLICYLFQDWIFFFFFLFSLLGDV